MSEPRVTVVIPTCNRKTKLAQCVSSLLNQTYQAFQIVIVDDASQEPVLREWFPPDLAVFILRNSKNRKQAGSRNRAMREFPADLYILLDDDCYVSDPRWIENHVRLHSRHPFHLIGGRIENVTSTLWGRARAALTRNGIQYGNFLQTMNLSFDAGVLRALGGFDERYGELEDVDFSQRARRQGIGLIYSDAIPVCHQFDDHLGAILRRNYQYGLWTVPVRKAQKFDGHWLLPGSFLASLLYYLPLSVLSTSAQVLLALRENPFVLLLSPLIFLYTLCHSAGIVRYHWNTRSARASSNRNSVPA
ncbi:MAG: glycosyltransferase family 2 protein [Acidobacteriota bacterium]